VVKFYPLPPFASPLGLAARHELADMSRHRAVAAKSKNLQTGRRRTLLKCKNGCRMVSQKQFHLICGLVSASQPASCRMNQAPLAVGCIRQTCKDVLLQEFRIVLKNFLMRHPCREPSQHIFHGNPHAANTWPSTTFSRFNRDDLSVIHSRRSMPPFRSARTRFFEFHTMIFSLPVTRRAMTSPG